MANFEITEQILAAPSKVFDFLTGLENCKLIDGAVRKTEARSSVALKSGDILLQSKGLPGKEVQSEYEILAIESPLRFHLRSYREGIEAIYRYELASLGNGTDLKLSAEVNGEGPRRFLAWFVAQAMKRRDQDLLERVELAIIKSQS